jgi:CHAT domain-containing protein
MLNDASPMYSTAAMAGAGSTAATDGVLEAWKIAGLDLRSRLVVLPDCRTSLNRFASDGLTGLSWALFVAGSSAVVANRWKIESPDLATGLYDGLGADSLPAQSLRESVINLLKTDRRHPYYWAGMIVMEGSPQRR